MLVADADRFHLDVCGEELARRKQQYKRQLEILDKKRAEVGSRGSSSSSSSSSSSCKPLIIITRPPPPQMAAREEARWNKTLNHTDVEQEYWKKQRDKGNKVGNIR